MTESVTIKEAAARLGISADTVRRRLKRGELTGEKEETPQGYVWRIQLPEEESEPAPAQEEPSGDAIERARLLERIEGLEKLTEELKGERDAWREQASEQALAAREMRVLLRNSQELALPAHVSSQEESASQQEPEKKRGFWAWLKGD